MIIYKVTNLNNQKVYIGQSVNSLNHRKNQHYKESKHRKNDTTYFHNALRKYPKQSFFWEVIEKVDSLEELNAKEIYWINYYNSTDKEKGYNLKLGGNNGGKCCDSTKRKIGDTTLEKWKNPEIAEKMRLGLYKGTKTVKQNALNNYKITYCKYCNSQFQYRPCDTDSYIPKFCSEQCRKEYLKTNNGLAAASKINKENKEAERSILKQLILEWIPNFSKYQNLKLNNLEPLFNELYTLTTYKDARTIMLVFDCTSKRLFFKKLSKIYAELIGNNKNQEIKSS